MVLFKMFAIVCLSLNLVLLAPAPGQGFANIPLLIQAYQDLKRDLPRYNENIRMSEATVNEIIDDMDGVKPGDGLSPNERIRDLKEGIKGELALAKQAYLPFTMAVEQLGVALDRYNKSQTQENFKNAQNIANQINNYRNILNGHLTNAQSMIRQIAMIRQQTDDKEWNNPDGKYQKEHQAIDKLWNWLAGTTNPDASLTKVPKAGKWQQFDLETKETRPITISWEGTTLKVRMGKKTYTGTPGINPSEIVVTHTMKTPKDVRVIQGPIPQKVLLQAIAEHDLSCTITMKVINPELLEGESDGFFQVQWESGNLKLRTFRREGPHRVRWRAL